MKYYIKSEKSKSQVMIDTSSLKIIDIYNSESLDVKGNDDIFEFCSYISNSFDNGDYTDSTQEEFNDMLKEFNKSITE